MINNKCNVYTYDINYDVCMVLTLVAVSPSQMGLMPDMASMDAMVYGDLENDQDLEAELAALRGEEPSPKPAKRGKNFLFICLIVLEVVS